MVRSGRSYRLARAREEFEFDPLNFLSLRAACCSCAAEMGGAGVDIVRTQRSYKSPPLNL